MRFSRFRFEVLISASTATALRPSLFPAIDLIIPPSPIRRQDAYTRVVTMKFRRFVLKKLWFRRLLVGLSVLVTIPVSAWAQVTASISGKVEDASSTGVPVASVTVKSL